MEKNFLEKWILNLVKLEYEFGNIPKRATYKLRERMDDFIEVTIEWIDQQNSEFKIVYNARAYGKKRLTECKAVLTDSIFELENYYTLEIHTYINNVKRNYSTRRIADYDVMKVIGELEQSNEVKDLEV